MFSYIWCFVIACLWKALTFFHHIVDSMLCFSQSWLFWIEMTVWGLGSYWDPSSWKVSASIYWTQIWILPPHKRSYCLYSLFAPLSCFLVQCMKLRCLSNHYFVCQTYIVILSELFLFGMGKIVILGGCAAGCHFLCNGIHRSCNCIPCLILILLSWSINMRYNFHDYWTFAQEELYFPLTISLDFCFYSSLSYTPNPSWVGEHLLWFIHIAAPNHHSQGKLCA